MSPPPRVLQVALTLNPGGTERLVVDLATRLHDELPTMVCCLDDEGAWAGSLAARGIEVQALHRTSGFRPSLGRAIASLARRHQATVIHAHHYSPFVYSCIAKCLHPSIRIVFTEHGRLSDSGPSRKRRIVNQVLAHFPQRVFTVSDELRQHLVEEGFDPAQVGVIYNGIAVGPQPDEAKRHQVRRALGAVEEAVVLGTIARLDPVKDLDTLLLSAVEVRSRIPMVLAIVGDGPERQRLEARAAELGIAAEVRFLGQRDDAREWLAGCDVYVNSSISEGISLTILEAMAAGLPIVATTVGGTPEIVDGTCGRLVPARNPAALTDAILEMSYRSTLRRRLGTEARARAESRFTIERMVGDYRDVYLDLSGSNAGTVRGSAPIMTPVSRID